MSDEEYFYYGESSDEELTTRILTPGEPLSCPANAASSHKFRGGTSASVIGVDSPEGFRGCIPLTDSIPAPGVECLARVLAVGHKEVKVDVLVINNLVLTTPYRGVLRIQDVRAFAVDQVHLVDCYKPGDIIRAEIVG